MQSPVVSVSVVLIVLLEVLAVVVVVLSIYMQRRVSCLRLVLLHWSLLPLLASLVRIGALVIQFALAFVDAFLP